MNNFSQIIKEHKVNARTTTSEFSISRAIKPIEIVAEKNQIHIWRDAVHRDDFKNDLVVMLDNDDLHFIALELFRKDKKILMRYEIRFDARRHPVFNDFAQGVEMPLIDQNLIAGHRMVISTKLRTNHYKHLLRMKWEPAKGLKKTRGTSYSSDHVQNVSGGRQACSIFVSDSERHILQIVTLTEQGYGFARDFNLNDASVFVHINDAEIQTLSHGQIISAVVIKTPKGFRARSIRAA